MANVNSWELEIPSSIPASKVFDGFVVGFFDFLDYHVFPVSLGVKFTNLQGDGGVGTIKLMSFEDDKLPSVKYKIKELDLDNFTYNMAVIEGEDDEQYELTLSEMKVIPSVNGGCTFRQKTTEYKGTDEDETESHKEQLSLNGLRLSRGPSVKIPMMISLCLCMTLFCGSSFVLTSNVVG